MKPFILASQSPRRKQLLEQVHLSFNVIPSDVTEIIPDGISPEETVLSLARQKAEDVLKHNPGQIVLGADTIVVSGDSVLGKPQNEEEAYSMLRQLSGRTHTVMTGVTIQSEQKKEEFAGKADVRFYPLSDADIRSYIASGEPFDKAGAYGIQGLGAVLVEKIEGDYFTIVGLPVAKVVRALKHF